MNSFANAAPAPGTPVEIKILGEPSPPPGLPPLAPGEPLPENKIPLDRNRLVALLTRLGVPRENYHIADLDTSPPSEDQLCLVRTKNNPYRTSLWKTFYIERGEQVSIGYFRAESAAVGMLASDIIGSISGEHFCPVNICLTVFFYVFAKSWMSIESLGFNFDGSDIRGPAKVFGTCGLLRLEIESSEDRLDIRLSMKREDGFAGLLRTTIDKPVSTRDAKEDINGEKWHFFRETFLPAYRHVVTKYVQRDRFAARDC